MFSQVLVLALGCSCPGLDFEAGASAADAIFEGVIEGDSVESSVAVVHVIHVTRVFKGDVSSRVLAASPVNGCGAFPERGVPWLFMFHPEARWFGAYELVNCGVISHPVSELTASQMASLGASHPPRAASTALVVALLTLVVAFAAAVWRFRKRRAIQE